MGKSKAGRSITKSEFFQAVAEESGMKKAEVVKIFDAITAVIEKQLGKKGSGVLTLPGLFKLKAKRVEAVKGGKMVPNRFKPGEMTVTKDKPAHTKVTARPLKALKEMLK
jgi:nucleoid DNA-binding protein